MSFPPVIFTIWEVLFACNDQLGGQFSYLFINWDFLVVYNNLWDIQVYDANLIEFLVEIGCVFLLEFVEIIDVLKVLICYYGTNSSRRQIIKEFKPASNLLKPYFDLITHHAIILVKR